MHLDPDEHVLRVIYHHYSPFIFKIISVILYSLPFYFLLFLSRNSLNFYIIFYSHLVVAIVISTIVMYLTFLYWMDRLVVTSKRIVYIDWKYLTVKAEYETELKDIQDLASHEKGIIAILPFFDYGTFEVKTASSDVTIKFENAPNPNEILKFIQDILIHHD